MYKMAMRCIKNENKGKLGSGYKNYRNGKEEIGKGRLFYQKYNSGFQLSDI
jgi:hypothetical protein